MSEKYVCTFCGFEYDEGLGVPQDGISPGTRWEDVQNDWVCPDCGNEKNSFQPRDW